MNERMRELWSQAGGSYNIGNQHTWPQYTIDAPEKFAELIVRECADVATINQYEAFTPGYYVKKHFGIENT